MQLVKVYANKESFRITSFKPGINFIIAKQKNPGSSEDGKTYNGVGKSLLIRIIHFCLGASVNDYKSFCDKLPDWEFCLDFQIADKIYTSKRKTEEPALIEFENERISIDKFKKRIEKLCFSIPDDISYLSFRSLIPFFIRPTKESYIDCKKSGKVGNEYQTLLYNSFLIGLDVYLVEKKYRLRKEQERIRKLEKNFKEDSLLRDFFTGDRDVSLTLRDLEDEIISIENDLLNFKVSDNYHEIQNQADSIENRLLKLNNEIILLKNNIENIEKSLQLKPTMSNIDLEAVYNESKILFPDAVKKTLNEIDTFYSKLLTNRILRLSEQKNQLSFAYNDKINESNKLKKEFDKLMKYLGEHQALDVFISLSQKVADLKTEKNNLERYQILQSEYKSKERQTDKDMIELSEITDNYLHEIELKTKNIKDFFRSLTKLFYPQSTSGLTVKTNEGENQLVFDIEPRIESDASDGIGSVKLFCYDLSILFKGQNHNIDFIFHDSRLYDGIDERQKTTMFKIIRDYFSNNNKQYISTINENQINEIKSNITEEEYKLLIENNTVLTLTDDSDSEKLLGIKVDIGVK